MIKGRTDRGQNFSIISKYSEKCKVRMPELNHSLEYSFLDYIHILYFVTQQSIEGLDLPDDCWPLVLKSDVRSE